jgi:hypothetical protein
MDNFYTLDSVAQETITAQGLVVEDQAASLSDVTEYAVTVELEPDVVLVTAGEQGPPGPAGFIEENAVYATRVDFVTDDLLYRGEAAVGTTNASPLWRIRRIIVGVDGDITEEWSAGNALFDKAWDDRLSGVYT